MAAPVRCFLMVAVVLAPLLAGAAGGKLSTRFYDSKCPNLQSIVRSATAQAVAAEPRMGASILRLFFNDCFVNGCDASILLDDTASFTGEKNAGPNANSVRGYEVIDAIKAQVEASCSGIVSCAHIVALAARDSVNLVKRTLGQFTPAQWDKDEWYPLLGPFRFIQVLSLCVIFMTIELNTFFLKFCLWIPPQNPLIVYRLVLWWLIAIPTIREYNTYLQDRKPVKKVGSFCWLSLAICIIELLICIKFGHGLFPKSMPSWLIVFWTTVAALLMTFLFLGGPTWTVQLGRRDALNASQSAANSNLPGPGSSLATLITMFGNKGLSPRDMTALSGAHTVGQARCTTFRDRIYNDANINASFAALRQQTCPQSSGGDGALAPIDAATPDKFDNYYYQNLMSKQGLFHSDQELFNGGSQDALVKKYRGNAGMFAADFAKAMGRMGSLMPSADTPTEIRLDCKKVN